MARALGDTEVGSLVAPKRPIISVPEEASVQTALKVMTANNIVALPVSAPPGKYLGAGASVIIDRDKQYIGLVSLVDVALHLAQSRCAPGSLDQPVRDLIGSTPEGLSLWVYQPDTKLADVLEPLSKGVHRILIRTPGPSGTHPQEAVAELASEPGVGPTAEAGDTSVEQARPTQSRAELSEYQFLSQMDVVAFFLSHVDELGPVVHRTLSQLNLVDPRFPALAVSESETVLSVLRLLKRAAGIRAVAVVADDDERADVAREGESGSSSVGDGGEGASTSGAPRSADAGGESREKGVSSEPGSGASIGAMIEQDEHPATWRRGGRLLGTLSVTDLRGLDADRLAQLSSIKLGDFLASVQGGVDGAETARAQVACRAETPLSVCMAQAVTSRVHRVWVTTEDDLLVGVVSLSDMIAVVRRGIEMGG